MSRISARAGAAAVSALLAGVGGIGLVAGQATAKATQGAGSHKAAHVRSQHAAKPDQRGSSTSAGQVANAQSAVGDFLSGPFHFRFHAYRAAGAPDTAATGSLTATLDLNGQALTMVTGPVTCLDIVGQRAALFYPISSANPFVLSALQGVVLYLQVGANGKPQSINYVPFQSHVSSCPPVLPGILPITSGTLTLSS